MGIGAAVAGSALIGAYSSKKAGDAQARAAKEGSDAQVQAAYISSEAQKEANQANIDFQKEIFQQQREDNAPWREVGAQSLQRLQEGVKTGQYQPGSFSFNFQESPGYQFRKQEGINALDASAAARGRLQSGAQSRAVSRYGSDLASQEYGNAWSRAMSEYQAEAGAKGQQFNQLASLANVGQVANSADQQARSQMASSVGQSTQATGNALAQSALQTGSAIAQGAAGAGQARASSYQNMAGAANQGIQNYLLYDMMGS